VYEQALEPRVQLATMQIKQKQSRKQSAAPQTKKTTKKHIVQSFSPKTPTRHTHNATFDWVYIVDAF
jgi:hypothetical protein